MIRVIHIRAWITKVSGSAGPLRAVGTGAQQI